VGSRRSAESPRKGEAQGSLQSGASLIRCTGQGTLERVKAWKSQPAGPARFASADPLAQRLAKRHAGSPGGVIASGTFREGNAPKGVKNPKSAVGMKQGRPGLEGRNPS